MQISNPFSPAYNLVAHAGHHILTRSIGVAHRQANVLAHTLSQAGMAVQQGATRTLNIGLQGSTAAANFAQANGPAST